MEARSGGEVCGRVFRLIIKEQVPWISARTIPKCKFSGSSFGSNTPSGSRESTITNTLRGGNSLWSKLDLVMVRRVAGLGGLRGMGVTNRPADRASQHGTRTVLPTTDEERHTEEFLKKAKKEQAAKVMKTEQIVGGVAGQSLAATDAEFTNEPGRNDADIQSGIAEEMTRKGELGAVDNDSEHYMDQHAEHASVDEEVKRGLVADSAFPIGRTEKKVDEDEDTEHNDPQTKGSDVSEHGFFKSHL